MKEVYSYQEVGSDIAQGETLAFIVHPTLHVRAVKKNPDSENITVTYEICIGTDAIGEFISDFPDIEKVLYAFDIADHEEIFELVRDKNAALGTL
jgi:hypothetical protein